MSSLLHTLGAMGGGARTPYQLGGFGPMESTAAAWFPRRQRLSWAVPVRRSHVHRNEGPGCRAWIQGRCRSSRVCSGRLDGPHTDMSIGGTNIESTTSNGISGVRTGRKAASPLTTVH